MKMVDAIGGEKLLLLTRGLANAEPVVLVDEPSGRAMGEHPALTALIAARKAQDLAFAERIADHYLVMDQSRIVLGWRPG
jgi:urea transport system ATP-binding protein